MFKKIVKLRLKDAVKASFGIVVKTFEAGKLSFVWKKSDCAPWQGSLNGTHFRGNQTMQMLLVILGDFPCNSALFGLVISWPLTMDTAWRETPFGSGTFCWQKPAQTLIIWSTDLCCSLVQPYIFGTRGRSLPDILVTGSLVPNIYIGNWKIRERHHHNS